MPKYFVDEETLRKWRSYGASDNEKNLGIGFDVEAEIAYGKLEADGSLSHYKAVQCSLDEENLSEISHLALSELRRIGVSHLVIDYDGGGGEGLTYFRTAQTSNESKDAEQLVQLLKDGPLKEAPPFLQSPSNTLYDFSIYNEAPLWRTLSGGTLFRIEHLLDELAWQLLGREFGMGDVSLEGAFVADLQSNTLTDIAPEED